LTPTLEKLVIQSNHRMDLCVTGEDIYLSQQSWVADQYSALISDACAVADRRTLEFHVPLAHLQAVGLCELDFQGETFKQLAFASRNGTHKWSEFEEIREMVSEYAVIFGPMLQAHNLSFEKMESWEDITLEHLLRNVNEPNDVARQYSWRDPLSQCDFEDVVEGKLYYRRPVA
jgi:hypothetical protein